MNSKMGVGNLWFPSVAGLKSYHPHYWLYWLGLIGAAVQRYLKVHTFLPLFYRSSHLLSSKPLKLCLKLCLQNILQSWKPEVKVKVPLDNFCPVVFDSRGSAHPCFQAVEPAFLSEDNLPWSHGHCDLDTERCYLPTEVVPIYLLAFCMLSNR